MTLGVRAWVENADGEVALVRHTYTPGLYFPGGGVERAEPALEALRREMHEEIGAIITGVPDLVGVFSNHRIFPNDHVVFYRIPHAAWIQDRATSRGEIEDIVWTSPRSLPSGVTPGTRRRFEEALEGVSVSPFW